MVGRELPLQAAYHSAKSSSRPRDPAGFVSSALRASADFNAKLSGPRALRNNAMKSERDVKGDIISSTIC